MIMNEPFKQHLARQLSDIRAAGLYKTERVITSPQQAQIDVTGRPQVLNFCAKSEDNAERTASLKLICLILNHKGHRGHKDFSTL